jgi:hypothetical protein
MTEERKPQATGGCQCGKVRYALYAALENPHICHCRMCQKAFGNYFAPFAGAALKDFAWTAGEAASYASSPASLRFFCRDCGTPLAFRYRSLERIGVALGSLDDPTQVAPLKQYGIESRLPFTAGLTELPALSTEQALPPELLRQVGSARTPDRQ